MSCILAVIAAGTDDIFNAFEAERIVRITKDYG